MSVNVEDHEDDGSLLTLCLLILSFVCFESFVISVIDYVL